MVGILHPLVQSTSDRNGDDSGNLRDVGSQTLGKIYLAVIAHQLQRKKTYDIDGDNEITENDMINITGLYIDNCKVEDNIKG